jgi:ABC-type lipoprotein release transport system permease subunit
LLNWLSLMAKDLKFASRLLFRSPAVSLIAVTALAIGIGLTTSMFSIVNGTILRGLPFEESHQLLSVLTYKPEDGVTQPVAVEDFADWRERQTSFQEMAVWRKDLAFLRTPDGKAESSEAEAQVELSSIAQRLALEYPQTNRGFDAMVGPYINEVVGERIVNLAYMMLAAVFGVLLVACANVAILQLTRATLRTKEVAARLALGASRARVMAQSLSEAVVLSVAGALVGLVVAQFRIEKFNEALHRSRPAGI